MEQLAVKATDKPSKATKPGALFTKANDYFFDVEPEEPIDWASVSIFYGACGLCVGMAIVFAALVIFG